MIDFSKKIRGGKFYEKSRSQSHHILINLILSDSYGFEFL
jgi:hypothetical protein